MKNTSLILCWIIFFIPITLLPQQQTMTPKKNGAGQDSVQTVINPDTLSQKSSQQPIRSIQQQKEDSSLTVARKSAAPATQGGRGIYKGLVILLA